MARLEAAAAAVPGAGAAVKRRLIINADDFGRSSAINEAVIRAHADGVLTTASLMVNEEGFEEAVTLAREHPRLGVGLHLSLVCGRCGLPAERVPALVGKEQQFIWGPVTAGMRFFFQRDLREQLRAEIDAQFEKFASTGLPLDHVNGHLHFHLHPTVLPMVLGNVERHGVRAMRVTHDPLALNRRLASGRWMYRFSHAAIFRVLSRRARRQATRAGLRHTSHVFGLLQDSLVDEDFMLRLLAELPEGDSELYSHPSPSQFKHELDALLSPKVKRLIGEMEIELIRYQDL